MTYTVNAYSMVNAWGTGLNHKGAKALFQIYYEEGHADIRMKAN